MEAAFYENESAGVAQQNTAPFESDSSAGDCSLGVDQDPFGAVLNWISAVDDSSPALSTIPGPDTWELKRLARLSSLILTQVGQDSVPKTLWDELSVEPRVLPTRRAADAFARLIKEDPVERLGALYTAVIRQSSRRWLGTFFTPREAADSMIASYSAKHANPRSVVDVGAGVGVFSEAARTRWPEASIRAIDLNPVTLGLQAVVTTVMPEWKVSLELGDYRAWLSSHQPKVATLYLGNPPYTRWQLLDISERARLLESAQGLVGTRANLSTLFLAMTLVKLRKDDSLSLIIPAGWMRADYARGLRARLRQSVNRHIALRIADSWRFDGAIVDTVVVEVGPDTGTPQPIRLSDWSGAVTSEVDRTQGDQAFPLLTGSTFTVNRMQGGTARNRLGDLAKVTRGTATGAHEFFIGRVDEWVDRGVSDRFLRPLARRMRLGQSPEHPTVERSALLVLDGYQRGTDSSVDSWLAYGESQGIHERHLCGNRSVWFDLSREIKTPDIILAAFGREEFRMLENFEGLAISNNMFGMDWAGGVSASTRRAVMNWLRAPAGQAVLQASASIEANGLHRLSPRLVAAIELPWGIGDGVAH